MDYLSTPFVISLLEIIWIDILLSGDNAVVIALACRSLPANKQKMGIRLGAATAVLLRIVFATIITYLLAVPYLRIVGGLMLLSIAINLLKVEEEVENNIKDHDSLFAAVRTIAIADVVMSLDNVVAVAAASKGHIPLFVIGLLISIPFVVIGASLITKFLLRFPILIWFGGALLGWIAGEMIVTDPYVASLVHALNEANNYGDAVHYASAVAGAVIVVACGFILARKAAKSETLVAPTPKTVEPQSVAEPVVRAAKPAVQEEAASQGSGDRWMVVGLAALFVIFGIFLTAVVMIPD